MMPTDYPEHFRSGFVSLVGRPNVGKSTLTNAMVGSKIAITSSKPQTTRRVIRGIVSGDDHQLILVDTPGLHRPRTLLGERLNELVAETLAGMDAVAMCIPANEKIGPGDRFIAEQLAKLHNTPIIALVTKVDTVTRGVLADQLIAVQQLGEEIITPDTSTGFTEIVPVSVQGDVQVNTVVEVLTKYLPKSPPLYPDGEVTDEPDDIMVAELIREAALEDVFDELPHSLAVVVTEMGLREGQPEDQPITDIYAEIYVERDSQKGIIIGKGGRQLQAIGQRARKNIQKLLGTRVYLDLVVKVAKEWQRNPKYMNRLGF
ncbi:GTPase Era [Enteractinococcus coprophilus]|uniref:GTPase Era n=1 Tax=Enteractinococcus coprophilus TaxID=1027633 RepID=A0A543AJE8_9MICC|nr:GTPase Era [Enteractinococcus coprophilus]TQL72713.1 GTP-binding protein Era [Enteractinococcus coprophilus]